jgi:hypothetical protein
MTRRESVKPAIRTLAFDASLQIPKKQSVLKETLQETGSESARQGMIPCPKSDRPGDPKLVQEVGDYST